MPDSKALAELLSEAHKMFSASARNWMA